MLITKTSRVTGKVHTREIDVTVEQLGIWAKGGLIQDVMPNVSDDDREFLLTGITPEEWKELFGSDDGEDD